MRCLACGWGTATPTHSKHGFQWSLVILIASSTPTESAVAPILTLICVMAPEDPPTGSSEAARPSVQSILERGREAVRAINPVTRGQDGFIFQRELQPPNPPPCACGIPTTPRLSRELWGAMV